MIDTTVTGSLHNCAILDAAPAHHDHVRFVLLGGHKDFVKRVRAAPKDRFGRDRLGDGKTVDSFEQRTGFLFG